MFLTPGFQPPASSSSLLAVGLEPLIHNDLLIHQRLHKKQAPGRQILICLPGASNFRVQSNAAAQPQYRVRLEADS
jgi:hypothetical protein